MVSRPRCSQATTQPDSPCLFCGPGVYCAHQAYCPVTGRYENTEGFRACKRLNQPEKKRQQPVNLHCNIVPSPAAPSEPKPEKEERRPGNGCTKEPASYAKRRAKKR